MTAPAWLRASWGKFKCHQRTLDATARLSQDQMRAAWSLWSLLQSSGEGDSLNAVTETVRYLAGQMDEPRRRGIAVFARWLKENRERLSQQLLVRTVAESAQTTDTVSVQLIKG